MTFRTQLQWSRSTTDFKYETYNRNHKIRFEGGIEIAASSAPEFKGDSTLVNPEEQLVAALSSCHMLTFLAVACKKGFIVETYSDSSVGTMGKNSQGRLAITGVVLSPKITFTGKSPSAEELAKLHDKSHESCFIANSVNFPVEIETP